MGKSKQQKKGVPAPREQEPPLKDFLDRVAPGVIQFRTDHYLCGNTFRCVWALREYPTATKELALLRRLGERSGVTLHIYHRMVDAAEEERILHAAENRDRLRRSGSGDLRQAVLAEADLRDMADLVERTRQSREPLVHCAVFLELTARDLEGLKALQAEVLSTLTRSRLNVDRLLLRQREGFLSVNPAGHNAFGAEFERVLPASSEADLFPLHFSGKTDPRGFYLGRDKYGSNVIVDLSRRAEDKTNESILILGSSGQGKSYLLKLLVCNLLESGKYALCLDPEHEMEEPCRALGGCFVDLMGGDVRINLLEPKRWDDGSGASGGDAPGPFRQATLLSQHISFLKDCFRAYKDLSDPQADVLELMLGRLYAKWGISDQTDFSALAPEDYPILSDFYALLEEEYAACQKGAGQGLYPPELLRDLLLGLHSLCRGADSRFFNGPTNVTSHRFLVFGVKDALHADRRLRDLLLLNVLSYFSHRLLTVGNTVAVLDELYLFLSVPVMIEYIRNFMKRARKKDSSLLLASQNLEDFNLPGVAELTRPLFAIPTHQFLFYAGNVDSRFYTDNLQLSPSEYELIRQPHRGVCLYKCGSERYLLAVEAPKYKEALFGTAGGK